MPWASLLSTAPLGFWSLEYRVAEAPNSTIFHKTHFKPFILQDKGGLKCFHEKTLWAMDNLDTNCLMHE